MGADGQIRRVRLKFERDYTQIPNEWLRDQRLSRGARGLLGELMSHDENFTISVKQLIASGPEGRYAMDTIIGELKANGYLELIKIRGRYGRLEGVVWQICDPAEIRERHREQPTLDRMPDFPAPGKSGTRETQQPDNLHLKEAHSEEHLPTEIANVGSTRAGAEKDASGDSYRAAADKACVVWTRTGHHDFRTQDPHERCYHCGRVDLAGSVFDLDGNVLSDGSIAGAA